MARKNLLDGLMNQPPRDAPPDPIKTRVDVARPRYGTGAIGAVSQSIAELKSRSVIEIDPNLIDAGGLADRVEETVEDHDALVASIRDYGQQVPILVRPHPETPGRYQIVYGRRRVVALRALNRPAKALVRDLDDSALVMAQGQENSARRDLSFIEKCNFARQMRDAKYKRKAICAALSVDKTLISRMLSIADRIPTAVIERIGSAPGIGRDRWSLLADTMEQIDIDPDTMIGTIVLLAGQSGSDERFEAAMSSVGAGVPRGPAPAPRRAKTETVSGTDGRPIGRIRRTESSVVLTLSRNDGFEDWLADNLSEIHRDWHTRRDE